MPEFWSCWRLICIILWNPISLTLWFQPSGTSTLWSYVKHGTIWNNTYNDHLSVFKMVCMIAYIEWPFIWLHCIVTINVRSDVILHFLTAKLSVRQSILTFWKKFFSSGNIYQMAESSKSLLSNSPLVPSSVTLLWLLISNIKYNDFQTSMNLTLYRHNIP